MVKFIASLLVVMAISFPAAAYGTKVAVGWLIGFDELTDEVFLDDGKTYHASPRINFSLLNPGERFFIEFVQTRWRKKIVVIIPFPVLDERQLTSADD